MYSSAHEETEKKEELGKEYFSEYEIPKEERISKLRQVLKDNDLEGCILYRSDPHLNEYVHPHYEHIAWLTGFTGSNATLLVLPNTVYLYTDARYFIQAKKQLSNKVELSRIGIDPSISERLLTCNAVVGVNPRNITQAQYNRNFKTLHKHADIEIIESDLLESLWTLRPKIESGNLEVMKHQESVNVKLQKIRKEMESNKEMYSFMPPLDMVIISDMDEIAWATNLRGTDIPMSRLFYSFLIVTDSTAILFTDASLTSEIPNILVMPYSEFDNYIKELSGLRIGVSTNTNYHIVCSIVDDNKVCDFKGILNLKAIKTENEINGFKEANKRDAKYLCMLFGKIKKRLSDGEHVGELEAADMLLELKSSDSEFIVPSFDTISGYGENGACIHYSPVDNTTKIGTESLFLIDCGSQYTMGTTDITRTVCFGQPTEEQRRDYTTLIKSHIDLENTPFPEKTSLGALSPIVRKHVWKEGLDYGHSTGHGVGFGLNVHEGPQTMDTASQIKAVPGMNITIEPGIYKEGKYGIRHENLGIVKKYNKKAGFLRIQNITPVPLHMDLINPELLTADEIDYINAQSIWIKEMLEPELLDHKEGLAWLSDNTRKISKKQN
ncbi:Xaa-Pro aminopeptidase [Nematocida ausubeli]|nr:Xaa-Pro aminopeptidase [Nematocida ausubeli]